MACRAKKAPLLFIPCMKMTGDIALMRKRAHATEMHAPEPPTSGVIATMLVAGVGADPMGATPGKNMVVGGTAIVASPHWALPGPLPGTVIVPMVLLLRITRCEPGGPRPRAMISSTAGPIAPEPTAAAIVG